MTRLTSALSISLLTTLGLAWGCSSSGGNNCKTGVENCRCYDNDTCNDGLECRSHVCVEAATSSGGASNGGSGNGQSGTGPNTGGANTGGSNPSAGGDANEGGSNNNGGSGGSAAGESNGGTSSGGSSGGAEAPVILSFSSNVTALTPNESLIVTAVITDPQGIADVVGGTLADPGGATYGSFAVSTVDGSYSVTLSWTAINTLASIDAPSGGVDRTFVATFFDQVGNMTSDSLTVHLECETATDGICDGECSDLQQDDANCATCGHDCGTNGTCVEGTCFAPGGCFTVVTVTDCNAACTAGGATCSSDACGLSFWGWGENQLCEAGDFGNSVGFQGYACNAAFAADPYPPDYARCCCTVP
jgi:hypothetical protein